MRITGDRGPGPVPALQRQGDPGMQGTEFSRQLQDLQDSSLPQQERVEKACRIFESFFVQKLLQDCRIFQAGDGEDGDSDPVLDMGLEKVAEEMTREGFSGLSEALERQMTGQEGE